MFIDCIKKQKLWLLWGTRVTEQEGQRKNKTTDNKTRSGMAKKET